MCAGERQPWISAVRQNRNRRVRKEETPGMLLVCYTNGKEKNSQKLHPEMLNLNAM
jgi:hypothetical protein